MKITYKRSEPEERPLGMVAEARVELEHGEYGALTGVAITGFGVWEPTDSGDELRVTLPARVYESGETRERYNLLVPADPERSTKPLENAIRDGWAALGETSGTVTI